MSKTNDLPVLTPAYNENSRWMIDHIDELARDFPNQWVAIHNNTVVAANPELGVVRAAVPKTVPPEDVVVHFVDDGSLIFTGL